MKKLTFLLILLTSVVVLTAPFFERPACPNDFNLDAFGRIPVLANGRIKPLDTVARTTLLMLQGRQRVSDSEKSELLTSSPVEWLADVLFEPALADTFPTFRIDSSELLSLLGVSEEEAKIHYDSAGKRTMAALGFLPSTNSRFSFKQIESKLEELDRQNKLVCQIDSQMRSVFQRAVVQLADRVTVYQRLKYSAQIPDTPDFLNELTIFQSALPAGQTAVVAKQKGVVHDENSFKAMVEMAKRYGVMDKLSYLLVVPPSPREPKNNWHTAGNAMLGTFDSGKINADVMAYAALGHAWREKQPQQFNEVLHLFREQLAERFASEMHKCDAEATFNRAKPFYSSITLYVLAFFLAIFSWMKCPDVLARSALWTVVLAWVATTAGIIARMWLEGRPPVTNLYSSALFVGWGAIGLCLILEHTYRNAIGSAAAGLIGFGTLVIAHNLSLSGDTLEMMRAVLDSNFWLATHVVAVTIGYASTFLAGFLALIYVIRGVFTKSLGKVTADALASMVYGIVCFATLFSLIGTVLGGIWADQSWGRFWGWDPKESGALIIVIWNALILHARWDGMIKQRGLMALALFGNVVTGWSWFGTNMLGIGLHSYGFMDAAFYWLISFAVSQLAFIALANLPLDKWRSFRST